MRLQIFVSGLCIAGTAWELGHMILTMSLGAASATVRRHGTAWTRGDGAAALLEL